FVIRSGLLVGAFYYTKKAGVWGSPEETEKLYNNIKNELRPHAVRLEKQLPFEIPALPQTGEIRFVAKHYYNEGVKNTFHFIEMLPCYTGQMIKKAKNKFDEFSQPPKATDK
ncbi:hypothetical protein DOY81_008738, partial [Sarcophaga bullata]